MFKIRRAELVDVDQAVSALADAFAEDPLMLYLFHEHPIGVRAGAMEFFTILLQARIAVAMPAQVLQQGDEVLGAVMGYDTSRPAWPEALNAQWGAFEASVPEFSHRLAAYERICEAHQPAADHYYLGVIGVHPSLQGRGVGKAMLDAFCESSRGDGKSSGVYLDTSNASSLQFYYRNGFELRGEGRLDDAPLWCVYKPT